MRRQATMAGVGGAWLLAAAVSSVGAQTIVGPLTIFDATGPCPSGTLEPEYGCHPAPIGACGASVTYPVWAVVGGQRTRVATIGMTETADGKLWVAVGADEVVRFDGAALAVGNPDALPIDATGNPIPSAYSYQIDDRGGTIPGGVFELAALGGMPASFSLVVSGERLDPDFGEPTGDYFVGWAEGIAVGTGTLTMLPPSACAPACSGTEGFRTQTMGGWGSRAHGANPGAYRDANFAHAFPAGLRVGCVRGGVHLTSASAVRELLPTGGPPARVVGLLVDPTRHALRNVLAGQTIALALSVGFDRSDPDFAAPASGLGALVLRDGTYQGRTVAEVLAIAEAVLGGCDGQVDPAEINDAVTRINENFVDGLVDGGFLACR